MLGNPPPDPRDPPGQYLAVWTPPPDVALVVYNPTEDSYVVKVPEPEPTPVDTEEPEPEPPIVVEPLRPFFDAVSCPDPTLQQPPEPTSTADPLLAVVATPTHEGRPPGDPTVELTAAATTPTGEDRPEVVAAYVRPDTLLLDANEVLAVYNSTWAHQPLSGFELLDLVVNLKLTKPLVDQRPQDPASAMPAPAQLFPGAFVASPATAPATSATITPPPNRPPELEIIPPRESPP